MNALSRNLATLFCLALATPASALLHMSVSIDGSEDPAGDLLFPSIAPVGGYLSRSIGEEVRALQNRNVTGEMARTRTADVPVLMGPAQVIGSALRNGYEAVARFPGDERAVLVAMRSSGIQTIEQARGKRLVLPAQDALATYLILGELKDKGLDLKKFFASMTNHRYHESALYALTVGAADVAAVSERIAKKWLAEHDGITLYQTTAVPSYGIAVRGDLSPGVRERLRQALLQPKNRGELTATLGVGELQVAYKEDYAYVAHLGYFTPANPAGTVVVTAAEVAAWLKRGARVFDVRSEKDYGSGHIPGANNLPYDERSKKETNFDAKLDRFDLNALPQDRATPLIFHCNGAECWKSYKASMAAIKAGYQKVMWFRGGFPEWKQKGLPLEKS